MPKVPCRPGERCADGDFVHSAAGVKHRRSQRILMDLPLVVRGESKQEQAFQERTFTITVSAHGVLVPLASTVDVGQQVVLMNPKSWDEREGRVTYLGRPHAGLAQVGIEFTEPAPEFWSISSFPSD